MGSFSENEPKSFTPLFISQLPVALMDKCDFDDEIKWVRFAETYIGPLAWHLKRPGEVGLSKNTSRTIPLSEFDVN